MHALTFTTPHAVRTAAVSNTANSNCHDVRSNTHGSVRVHLMHVITKQTEEQTAIAQLSCEVGGWLQAGQYTADYLRELQSQQRASPVSADVGGLRLQGSFKPAATERRTDGLMDGLGRPRPSLMPAAAEALGLAATATADDGGVTGAGTAAPGERSTGGGGGFAIPDAAAIQAAKSKRERLRNAAAAPDYVALRGEDGAAARAPARVRNEGSSEDEEDDADVRLQFIGGGGGGRSVLASVAHEQDGGAGVEQEEEEDQWVLEQLKKGVSSAGAAATTGGGGAAAAAMVAAGSHGRSFGGMRGGVTRGGAGAKEQVAEAAEAALAALRNGAAQLEVRISLCVAIIRVG
jgi:hypothetical protein